jgi:hypothetical protein
MLHEIWRLAAHVVGDGSGLKLNCVEKRLPPTNHGPKGQRPTGPGLAGIIVLVAREIG